MPNKGHKPQTNTPEQFSPSILAVLRTHDIEHRVAPRLRDTHRRITFSHPAEIVGDLCAGLDMLDEDLLEKLLREVVDGGHFEV